jgi:hypothetical protein
MERPTCPASGGGRAGVRTATGRQNGVRRHPRRFRAQRSAPCKTGEGAVSERQLGVSPLILFRRPSCTVAITLGRHGMVCAERSDPHSHGSPRRLRSSRHRDSHTSRGDDHEEVAASSLPGGDGGGGKAGGGSRNRSYLASVPSLPMCVDCD